MSSILSGVLSSFVGIGIVFLIIKFTKKNKKFSKKQITWLLVASVVVTIGGVIYNTRELRQFEAAFLTKCGESTDEYQCRLALHQHSSDCMAKRIYSKTYGQGMRIYQRCMTEKIAR